MMDVQARLLAAKAKKEAAEKAITDADRAEMAAREELAKIEAETREAEAQKRGLDLERRFDAAKETLGALPLRGLAIKDTTHTFVLRAPGAKAYNEWEKGIAASATASVTGAKVDRAAISRAFAVASVHDWNGITDFGPSATDGDKLIKFLTAYPAIASDIVNIGVELAKMAAEERKSGG